MSEHWPPEWDDPEDENLNDAERDDENLAEVTAALASLPLPPLPEAFEARISAAISAEAATRGGPNGAAGGAATVRSSSPDGFSPAVAGREATTAPAASLRRAARGSGARPTRPSRATGPAGSRPRRARRVVRAVGSLAACLVLAGFGYLVFGRGGPSGSTYSSALAPAASASASAFHAASGTSGNVAGVAGGHNESGLGQNSRFVVSETGTRYEPATLAGQARAAIAAPGGSATPESEPVASASAAASSGTGGFLPSAALAGCVYHLTGNRAPSLVDRASYAGRPAYIIVTPRRAWVVGLGCTAASPELVTSVALAGLSGNLRALGSVERRAILRKGACSDRRT